MNPLFAILIHLSRGQKIPFGIIFAMMGVSFSFFVFAVLLTSWRNKK
jgi:hypothetical protein